MGSVVLLYLAGFRYLSYFSFFGMLVFVGESFGLFSFSGFSFLLSYLTFFTILVLAPHVESAALLFFSEMGCVFSFFFFVSSSTFLSWLSFEMSSLPVFLMIFLWGKQKEKMQALMSYLVYSVLAASVFLLFYVLGDFFWVFGASSLSFFWSNLALVPFLIKLPCFFFHLWLIMAHVEAPTIGSVVLASILLKLGSVGFFLISFALPSSLLVLSLFGFFFLTLYLSSLNNLKLLVAYSSVLSMGHFLVGVFLGGEKSELASFLIQFAHSVTSSLLFLLAGWVQVLGGSLNLLWVSFQNQVWVGFLFLYNSGTYVGILFLSEFLLLGSSHSVFLFLFLLAVLGSLSYNLLVPLFTKKEESPYLDLNLFLGIWSVFLLNNLLLLV